MKKKYSIVFIFLVLAVGTACDDYLDVKPDQSLVVPSTMEDIRLLLDNTTVLNKQPVLTLHGGDEYFVSDEGLPTLGLPEQGAYLWLDDLFQGDPAYDWSTPYQQVFYANVALDALEEIPYKDGVDYKTLRGEALFHRAHAYYHLLQEFAPPYQLGGENEQLLGIILKDSPDVNSKAERSTLEESYSRVLMDLTEAATLLPDFQLPKSRPTKAAALGMLARLKLCMFDYEGASDAAEEALEIYTERLDFNNIDVAANRPFVRFGEETVFYSELVTVTFIFSSEVFVDTTLIESYQPGDLRLQAYFDQVGENRYQERGRLTGNILSFGGLSTGELELMAAEGLAWIGEEEKAREYLNSLLSRRIKPESFIPVDAVGEDLVNEILLERKKELVGRGLRWTDLRRLNQYPEHSKKVERIVEGQLISLEPNSLNYVFPIPDEEIVLSGVKQNAR
ncbi:RagB/SusD family nutrient uptake outer membrane protein [Algoriphagus winogradskyi]|uniref:SusD family protein n=1 Tax=Algoriphagus winogradskyi TaxID=237017 RepID=A0ABY1P4J8_9BACT|nr:RagB/SusD family nutrient uptake outer membrane protein [Algoriphagus winogradskyi]SMP26328.1 SusD family protein [Algoriphagus winogradskyi]